MKKKRVKVIYFCGDFKKSQVIRTEKIACTKYEECLTRSDQTGGGGIYPELSSPIVIKIRVKKRKEKKRKEKKRKEKKRILRKL